eukprot:scaffold121_cov356-Pavlova_lutheri.AAC.5
MSTNCKDAKTFKLKLYAGSETAQDCILLKKTAPQGNRLDPKSAGAPQRCTVPGVAIVVFLCMRPGHKEIPFDGFIQFGWIDPGMSDRNHQLSD